MQLEFVGQSASDRDNIAANPSRLVNCYREPIASAGRAGYAVKSVLGLADFVTLGGPVRAVGEVSRVLYAVAGGALFRVSAAQNIGPVADGDEVAIEGNNGNVTVTVGGRYFVWNGAALSEPTAGAFSTFGGHDYIGNYTVLTEASGRRFQWSDVANPSSLPGLNFSTADGRDDLLIRPVAINGALYLFKETSHEVWYLTGAAGAAAFERQAGGVVDVGLKSYNLMTKIQGGAFFVGNDNRAHVLSGTVQPVSIPPVETAITQGQPSACFTYEDEGHTFCVITFTDRPAWVYDIATGEWHERGEGVELTAWGVNCAAKSFGSWFAGRGDKVMIFARVATDGDAPLVREMTSRTLYQDGQRFVVSELEVFPRQGFANAKVELSVSRDGGLLWSEPKARNIGPVGNYGGRVIWRGLGLCRQITARIRVSETAGFTVLAEGRVS